MANKIQLKKSTEKQLKKFSGVVSSIAFIADIITVVLFLRDIFLIRGSLTVGAISARVTVIIATFVFAVVLMLYAREEQEGLEKIIAFFAWIYMILAAMIFGAVSWQFILFSDYSFWEFIGYPTLILLVSGLGFILSRVTESITQNFAIPFMLVALEQILLWLYKIMQWESFSFNWGFLGTLCYFALAGFMIVVFIYELHEEILK